jgi:hypothetical protein
MQQRALYAYEYLHGDSSAVASQLRKRFDSALGGGTKLDSQEVTWPLEVTSHYFEYYRVKKPILLTEESFTQSFRQMHILASVNKAARTAEIKTAIGHTLFFAVQNKDVEEPPPKTPQNQKFQPI